MREIITDLLRELPHLPLRPDPIRTASEIAHVDRRFARKAFVQHRQDGQSSHAGVEYPYWSIVSQRLALAVWARPLRVDTVPSNLECV
jgi:hypothetical protein